MKNETTITKSFTYAPTETVRSNAPVNQKVKVVSTLPRHYQKRNREGFMTSLDVASTLKVTETTVRRWRKQRIFVEDIKDHNGVYWYSIERVEQLKAVYYRTKGDTMTQINTNNEISLFGDYYDSKKFTSQYESFTNDNIINQSSDEIKTVAQFITKAITHINETDYWKRRGLTIETCQHFNFGFVSNLKNYNKPALIIPTGDGINHYVARLIGVEGKDKVIASTGKRQLFNLAALNQEIVICVEGEVDAASLWQVGIEAVGLGGTGSFKRLISAVNALPNKPKCILLSLDNDEAGKECAEKFKSKLNTISIPSIICTDIYGKYKDANEFLCKNKAKLKIAFQNAIHNTNKLINLNLLSIIDDNDIEQTLIAVGDTIDKQIIVQTTTNTYNVIHDMPKQAQTNTNYPPDSPEYFAARINEAIKHIDCAKLSYYEWRNVGMALKSVDEKYLPLWIEFSKTDPTRYHEGECEKQWQSFKGEGITISTFFEMAKNGGYDEGNFWHEWHNTHTKSNDLPCASLYDSAQVETKIKESEQMQKEYDESVLQASKVLDSVTDFSDSTIFSKEVINAAALVKINNPDDFAKFLNTLATNTKNKKTQFDTAVADIASNLRRERKVLLKKIDELQQSEMIQEANEKAQAAKLSINELLKLEKLTHKQEIENDKCIRNMLACNFEGKVLVNVLNYEIFLKYDFYLHNCIGYNAFANRYVLLKNNLPWRKNDLINNAEWTDKDDAGAQNRINRISGGMNNTPMYRRVMIEEAQNHSFHPVRDYFASLPVWDGVPRAETVFIDALDVENTEYARQTTIKWLLAAVARIMQPGCKFDFCLTLQGQQGCGKSQILRRLATCEDWFIDSIGEVGTKDSYIAIQGKLIVEFAELKTFGKSSDETIKAFISATHDKFRPPYAATDESFARQNVFAATVNNAEFLRDKTGGRRWWIVVANGTSDTTNERLAKFTPKYINQVWSEVYHLYNELFKDGFDSIKLLPPQHILNQAEEVATQYTEGGSIAGLVEEYLNHKRPRLKYWQLLSREQRRDWYQGKLTTLDTNKIPIIDESDDVLNGGCDTKYVILKAEEAIMYVCAAEIAFEFFKVDNLAKETKTLREINEYLSHHDDWRRVERKTIKGYGRQRFSFVRKLPVVDD